MNYTISNTAEDNCCNYLIIPCSQESEYVWDERPGTTVGECTADNLVADDSGQGKTLRIGEDGKTV